MDDLISRSDAIAEIERAGVSAMRNGFEPYTILGLAVAAGIIARMLPADACAEEREGGRCNGLDR